MGGGEEEEEEEGKGKGKDLKVHKDEILESNEEEIRRGREDRDAKRRDRDSRKEEEAEWSYHSRISGAPRKPSVAKKTMFFSSR